MTYFKELFRYLPRSAGEYNEKISSQEGLNEAPLKPK
jgi:hypothetical protein